MNYVPVVLTLGIALISSAAHAQVNSPFTESSQEAGPPAASERFDTVLDGFAGSLDISEKETKTTLSLGGSFSAMQEAQDGSQQQDGLYWKIGAEIPIGGSSDILDAESLNLFSGGTTISAGLTWGHYSSDVNRLGGEKFKALREPAIEACEAKSKTNKERAACRSEGTQFFGESFVRKNLPNGDQFIARALFDPFFTFGIKGKVQFQEFEFTTPGVFADNDDRKTSYSGAITGVYYPSDAVSAFKLELEYGEVFEAQDQQIVCRLVVNDPADDCKAAAPGPPTQVDALVLRTEYRRFFPFSNDASGIGLAVSGSYDFESKDYGFEVPVFYKLGKKSPIIPGVKIGYSRDASKVATEDEDFTISLFLKQTFSVNP